MLRKEIKQQSGIMSVLYIIRALFRVSFWKYLLEKPADGINLWTAFWCRLSGHRCGVIFYNVGGDEPDYRCKNCFDDLG